MQVFAEKITREKALVYDLRVELNGERRYFIVRVPSAKRTAFMMAIKKDTGFQLEDYGDILYRGWDEPDEALKTILHDQYGMYQDNLR